MANQTYEYSDNRKVIKLRMAATALRRAAYLCLLAEAFEDEFQVSQIRYRLEQRAEAILHPIAGPEVQESLLDAVDNEVKGE